MTRISLLAIALLAPLLTAAAPIPGPILITGDLATAPRNPGLCHIRLGMSASAEPGMRAMILNLRASFAAGVEIENIRLWPAIPGQWTWHDVLFNGDCAPDHPQLVVHIQEAVCATRVKYLDCLPALRIQQGSVPLQLR
jgi:hypothetical protein